MKKVNKIKKSIKYLFWALLFCCMFLYGCDSEAAKDEVVMKLSGEEERELAQISTDKMSMTTIDPLKETTIDSKESQFLYIYVCGAVNNPGVYQLESGSRIYEAVEMAGGLTKEADQTCLNLAREILDGEQVVILTKQEVEQLQEAGHYIPGQGDKDGTKAQGSSTGLININTATVAELTTVSGIGESRAQAIITYRETYGAFRSVEDIKKVDGIKDGLFAKIKDKITV